MKKLLLLILLFLNFCMLVFSAESNNFFIPNLTKDETKKIIIGRALATNWQVKNDKSELKALFNNCEKDKIKIETSEDLCVRTYVLIRTYTKPIYKQYL